MTLKRCMPMYVITMHINYDQSTIYNSTTKYENYIQLHGII